MAKDDELELEEFSGGEYERPAVEATALVDLIQWAALTGDPMDNPELRELLEAMGMLSTEDIRQIVEEHFEFLVGTSPAALRSLNKIMEIMDDLGTWDFVELMRIFESKTDDVVFREHEQDDFRHLTDADRATLETVEELEGLVNDFVVSIGNQLTMLLNRHNALQEAHNALDSRFFGHAGDSSAHFVGDEKERFMQLSANFDNDLFMKPCRIDTTVDETPGEKVITETAVRLAEDILGNDVSYEFAWRTTRITSDGEIIVNISFDFDGVVVGAESRIAIASGVITKVVT